MPKQQGNRWRGGKYSLGVCVCVCVLRHNSYTHTQRHTCSTSDMENRPSHAQLTSNTLYTPQTIHLPGIAISGALKEALCQHFAKYLKKKKKLSSLYKCRLSLTANSSMSVKVTTQPCRLVYWTSLYWLARISMLDTGPRRSLLFRHSAAKHHYKHTRPHLRSRVRLPASGTPKDYTAVTVSPKEW